MEANPEFCWVTTELAILSLKRCKLGEISVEAREIRTNANSPHNLLFKSSLRDQAVYVHNFLLANTMRAIHCLQVFHGIPVMFHEDDRVGTSQRQAEPSDMGCEK
jgi:hypothetical protein